MKIPNWLTIISHFIVPAVFLFVAYIAIFCQFEITWQLIVALILACLPFILVLLARYIKKLKIGDHEYESPDEEKMPQAEVSRLAKAASPTQALAAPASYGALDRPAKKVLRTLWIYQRQHFGADDARRWGFGVHPSAPDYSYFRVGSTELLELGLTVENDKGMVFLTDKGMLFCRENKNAIDGGGDIWNKFGGE